MIRRGLRWVALGLGMVAALWSFREPLLVAAGKFLVQEQDPQPADMIVVLGGSLPDRMLAGVDLFQAGFAPRIVFAREPASPGIDELRRRGGDLPDRDELIRSVATQLGVPESAIVVLDAAASSTLSEADVVVPYLRRQHARRVLIVSSKIHTRRAGLIYRHVAPEIEFLTRATPFDPFDPSRWWRSPGQKRRVVIEYQKLAFLGLRRLFGRDLTDSGE